MDRPTPERMRTGHSGFWLLTSGFHITLLASVIFLPAASLRSQDTPRKLVQDVEVQGNVRVPAATILHYLVTASGKPFDEEQCRRDLRRLSELGLFRTLEVQVRNAGAGGVDVVYRVSELPVVTEFLIHGVESGQEEQIRRVLEENNLLIRTATPYRPANAARAAGLVRSYLAAKKHPSSEVLVREEEVPGNRTRVSFDVLAGPRLPVGEVIFTGNRSISSAALLMHMRNTKPAPFYAPWSAQGAYSPDGIREDLESLRSWYRSHGFAAVRIGEPEIVAKHVGPRWQLPVSWIGRNGEKLTLAIPIAEGPRFSLASVDCQGNAKAAAEDVSRLLGSIRAPCPYDASQLEHTRQKIVDAMGHAGYALAQVQLDQDIDESARAVHAHFRILAGDPVAVGKIDFEGNTRVRDKFLRRELVISEGEVFDSAKLDKSIARLNRSAMMQEIRRSDVVLRMNNRTELLDIVFHVKEKKRQGLYGTGGTGGIGGGYLGVLYSAFDLFGLGESLSLQLDGGAAQSNVLLDVVGRRFLGMPFTLGLSLFHRVTSYNVASVIPDTPDLVHLLRHRASGVRLSGAYPIGESASVGLAAQFQRVSTSDLSPTLAGGLVDSPQLRTDLAPSYVFDNTGAADLSAHGTRIAAALAWGGTSLLRKVDTLAPSFRLSHYEPDPLTRSRNSFALRLQAAFTRPVGGVPLAPERRLFPGDEILRGFGRGGMTPLAEASGPGAGPAPAGADSVCGASIEYRVPIRGSLSGSVFADVGWSGLSRRTSGLDPGLHVIPETDRLLRASVGGELRLQLPVLQRPGRLIFSWNPLRLDRLIQSAGSPLRLADPRGAVRFALGDIF